MQGHASLNAKFRYLKVIGFVCSHIREVMPVSVPLFPHRQPRASCRAQRSLHPEFQSDALAADPVDAASISEMLGECRLQALAWF